MSRPLSQLLSPVDAEDATPERISSATTSPKWSKLHRSATSPTAQDNKAVVPPLGSQSSASPLPSSPTKSHLNFILSSSESVSQVLVPQQSTAPAMAPVKRGRGRPRKHPLPPPAVPANGWSLSITLPFENGTTGANAHSTIPTEGSAPAPVVKRGRGRPRKVPLDPSLPPVPPRPRVIKPASAPAHRSTRKRKTTAIFSPGGDNRPNKPRTTAAPGVRRGRGRPRSDNSQAKSTPEAPVNPHVHRIVRRVRNRLSSMRINMAFVDAYEQTGWRQASSEKLKPTAELVAVRQKLVRHQRALLRELTEFDAVFAADAPLPKHASELEDDDDIVCSKCQSTVTSDGNDIVLCDCGKCHRAYHQQCLDPALTTLPAEDDEWYCPRCDGIFQCLVLLNATFGSTWESLPEVFPDLKAQEGEDATEGAPEAPLPDDDNASDEDFDKSSVEEEEEDDDDDELVDEGDVSDGEVQFHKATTDILDSTRRSMRSHQPANHDDDGDDSDEDVTKLIVHGKRRRKAVDYRKLHGEMFPNAAADDDDDKDEYVPRDTVEED